jgi:hypothetical protein
MKSNRRREIRKRIIAGTIAGLLAIAMLAGTIAAFAVR